MPTLHEQSKISTKKKKNEEAQPGVEIPAFSSGCLAPRLIVLCWADRTHNLENSPWKPCEQVARALIPKHQCCAVPWRGASPGVPPKDRVDNAGGVRVEEWVASRIAIRCMIVDGQPLVRK